MDWIQVLVILFGISAINVSLIGWMRQDMKSFEDRTDAKMNAFAAKVEGWQMDIQNEMKDFHGRMCTLEERYKNG
jgi:hypothetical protein